MLSNRLFNFYIFIVAKTYATAGEKENICHRYTTQNDKLSTFPMYSRMASPSLDQCVKACCTDSVCTSVNYAKNGYCELMSIVLDGPEDPFKFPVIDSSLTNYVNSISCDTDIRSKVHRASADSTSTPPSLIDFVKTLLNSTSSVSNTLTTTRSPAEQIKVQLCGTSAAVVRISTSAFSLESKFKIVGGNEATPHSLPWQVSVKYMGKHLCGGSLIHQKYVLTAAHCVQNRVASSFQAVLGAHNIKTTESGQKVVSVTNVIAHPNYNKMNDSNDFALLELSSPVDVSNGNNYINTVCLTQTDPAPGVKCLVSGWGAISDGTYPALLQETMVPLLSNSVCNDKTHYKNAIDNTMICAGYEEGGKDSCQGDSGGPLICRESSIAQWKLVGVVSWGDDCALAHKPGVYSRVSSAYQWISQQIK